MTDDAELLRQYAQAGSEDAFAELVQRYLPVVYASALRQTGGDAELAKDVCQTVCIDLARKARSLLGHDLLVGWLFTATRFAAASMVRENRRRQAREFVAVSMREDNSEPAEESWNSQLAPVLDTALAELSSEDRNAILLRFFQGKPLKEVGALLGLNEDAARMRVTRAVDKLHHLLKTRGVTVPAAALGSYLAAEAVIAPPAGLAAAISTAALAGTSVAAATVTATKAIAMTTLHKSIIGATIAVAITGGIYEARQAAQLRGQVEILQQQQGPLAGQVEQLSRERDGLTNTLAVMRDQDERLNANAAELPKLRGMIGTLRRELESQKAAAAKASTNLTEASMVAHKPGSYISKDQLADAGFKTPEAALQTYFQALLSGDYNRVVAAMTAKSGATIPEQREAFEKGFREAEEVARFQGIQMLAKKVIADDRVDVEFLVYEEGKAPVISIQQMVKEGGGWKAGNSQGLDESWGQRGQIQPLTP